MVKYIGGNEIDNLMNNLELMNWIIPEISETSGVPYILGMLFE